MLTREETELFELAYRLKIRVCDILNEMSYEEFQGWFEYFELRPIGWQEDHRTSLLMKVFGSTADPNTIFPSLAALNKGFEKQNSGFNTASLKGSKLFSMMLDAKGGDKLEFLKDK